MTRSFKRGALIMGVGVVALLGATGPALAQHDPAAQYQQDQNRYESQRRDYREARSDYVESRRAYDQHLADYMRARDAYDRRHGRGAYSRRYGAEPTWDDARWAGQRGEDAAYTSNACRNSNRSVAGGLIGAIAGAALGSNVAASNARTEGAVLGGLVGGAIGVGVGRATANCDEGGDYYTYDQTISYREGRNYRGRSSGQHNYRYYSRHQCRLAPAAVEWGGRTDDRYVRVCPDAHGRYRLTG